MQSHGYSLCGDVVSDGSNKTSRDQDSILDQIYKKQISSYHYHDDFNSL